MNIIEVNDPKTAKEFLHLPIELYKTDKKWIRPLDKDIENVFNPKKNKFFRHGKLIRWILKDNSGKTIGRVAAFVNNNTARKNNQPTGGMGFFECINDKEAAFLLFDACKAWLEEQEMKAMDGPINFGERNFWWGLLVDGFTPPTYGMNYNPPFYKDFFESYGFRDYFQQYTFGLKVDDPRPQKFQDRAEKFLEHPDFEFKYIDKKNLKKHALDFYTIYNKAWGKHAGFKKMNEGQAFALMNSMKPVILNELMWFGYHKGEPIAMFLMLEDLNQYFQFVNGKMDVFGKIKFMYHKWRGTCRKIFGIVFGVVPEFQGIGLEGAIIMAANAVVQPKGKWDDMEMTWIGDFNPKMVSVAKNLGADIVKTHITYRKLFDDSIPFERAKVID